MSEPCSGCGTIMDDKPRHSVSCPVWAETRKLIPAIDLANMPEFQTLMAKLAALVPDYTWYGFSFNFRHEKGVVWLDDMYLGAKPKEWQKVEPK